MYFLDQVYSQRLQNRKLRLEALDPTYTDENAYLLGNTTPPSKTHNEYSVLPPNTSTTTKPVCNDTSKTILEQAKLWDINLTRDLEMGYDFIPEPCPICFEIIWRDTQVVECFYCDKKYCNQCYQNIQRANHERHLPNTCPLCRGIYVDYESDQEAEHENENENEENILQVDRQQRRRNHRAATRRKGILKEILKLLMVISIVVFIFIMLYPEK